MVRMVWHDEMLLNPSYLATAELYTAADRLTGRIKGPKVACDAPL